MRISYVMGKDGELPSVLGLLHGQYATPHWGIWILVVISAVFGAYGVLNVDNLTRITLASNFGTFLVYGLTNLIALIAFWGRPSAQHAQAHRSCPCSVWRRICSCCSPSSIWESTVAAPQQPTRRLPWASSSSGWSPASSGSLAGAPAQTRRFSFGSRGPHFAWTGWGAAHSCPSPSISLK